MTFFGVHPATLVETLGVGGPAHHEPVVARDHLRAKLAAIDVS